VRLLKAPFPAAITTVRVGRTAEPHGLRHEVASQILGEDPREARYVEDVLFRVQGGELSPQLRENIDDSCRDASHPRVEKTVEAGRASTDYRDIDRFRSHAVLTPARSHTCPERETIASLSRLSEMYRRMRVKRLSAAIPGGARSIRNR
jgi:hypothetical protein